MKALVTGGTGFVGSHLVRLLNEHGHTVRVLYRSPQKLAILEGHDYEGFQGNLDDIECLKLACEGCDVVFHVAAKADYWKDDDKDLLFHINVDGTRNVLSAAHFAGVKRVIFTSSASAIGFREDGGAADENEPFSLPPERYGYAYSKVKAEEVVAEFVADGLDVVTLNPTVIIGPGDLNSISGTFIIETARVQWLTPISSGGLAAIDVRDVVQAHLNAVEKGRSGERYILNTANHPYKDWFKMIAKACDVPAPFFTSPDWMLEPTARLIDVLRWVGIQTPMDANQTRLGGTNAYFDGSKAHAELFTPQIDLMTSLRETCQWYRENGYIQHNIFTRLIDMVGRLR
jgi:dihydroflavonol-4-reductase